MVGKTPAAVSGLSIKVESRGSETGLAALLEGKVQIAAMSRRMTQQEVVEFKREFGYEPTEVPVAVDALAVFVHKDNPIEGLTLAELDAVFSKETATRVAISCQSVGRGDGARRRVGGSAHSPLRTEW